MTIDLTDKRALELVSPEGAGIDPAALARLCARIEGHIAEGRYPGAAIALARRGKLVAAREFGVARRATEGRAAVPADLGRVPLGWSPLRRRLLGRGHGGPPCGRAAPIHLWPEDGSRRPVAPVSGHG